MLSENKFIEKSRDKQHEIEVIQEFDKYFVLIEAEKLSMKEDFMKYKPKTCQEKYLKERIFQAIKKKVKNFYCPIYFPSLSEDDKGVCYASEGKKADLKSYNWWSKVASEYYPERNSRLGTRYEYAAFLAIFIKRLVEEGNSIEWAWNAVCNDSDELVKYQNSSKDCSESKKTEELTVCGFSIINKMNIVLQKDEETGKVWVASGINRHGKAIGYLTNNYFPVTLFCGQYHYDYPYPFCSGWIVVS